jgi:hypothetical protein
VTAASKLAPRRPVGDRTAPIVSGTSSPLDRSSRHDRLRSGVERDAAAMPDFMH